MARVFTTTFETEEQYESWHYDNYDSGNGIKECGFDYLDNGQIQVKYINVRGN
jgi:hypothetical protein